MTRLAIHTAVVLSILAGAAMAWTLRYPILLFVMSLAISAALRPLVDGLIEKRWPKTLAVTAAYAQVFGSLALLLIISAQPLMDETKQFSAMVLEANDEIVSTWPDRGGWRATIVRHLPPRDELYHELLGSTGASLLQAALGATFSLFANLVDGIIVIVMSLYWSIDRDRFERLWISVLPARRRAATREIWRAIEHEAGDYLRSEIVQSIGAALLLWAGLKMLGHPFPTIVAAVGAIAWLIPWVGMLVAAAGVVVFALPTIVMQHGISGNWLPLSVGYTLTVLLVLEVFVEPRVFGRRRYNSLLVAVVMIGLADSLGIVGLVLGPPLAAIVQTVGARVLRRRMASETEVAEVDFTEKIAHLRESITEDGHSALELANIVERLTTLVDEAQPVLPSEPATSKEGDMPRGTDLPTSSRP